MNNKHSENELMQWVEMLLDRGYTIEQIENILGVKLEVRTQKVQMVMAVFRTQCLGEFEVNMN